MDAGRVGQAGRERGAESLAIDSELRRERGALRISLRLFREIMLHAKTPGLQMIHSAIAGALQNREAPNHDRLR